MADEKLRLLARAWAAYERQVDKNAPMPFALRREAHQAFYAGAAVALQAANRQEGRKGKREALDAIEAEVAEWSAQFDGYLFDDSTH